MRSIALITVILTGVVLLYGTPYYPGWGDPKAPAHQHVSPYYITHAVEDTAVPNIVTAVLADYRAFDTMFETAVIFTAGVACFFLLRNFRHKTSESRL